MICSDLTVPAHTKRLSGNFQTALDYGVGQNGAPRCKDPLSTINADPRSQSADPRRQRVRTVTSRSGRRAGGEAPAATRVSAAPSDASHDQAVNWARPPKRPLRRRPGRRRSWRRRGTRRRRLGEAGPRLGGDRDPCRARVPGRPTRPRGETAASPCPGRRNRGSVPTLRRPPPPRSRRCWTPNSSATRCAVPRSRSLAPLPAARRDLRRRQQPG